ncbi:MULTISPECIES: carbon-nitrogen hydrolase family protein [unclassified Microbacterium]|uniref:carbon-nitrogen hydrolase family protein n=1 Tax=unclassified Microbacterium TaxID=2609290 RepID=UPI00214CD791|nr:MULTISPECIES: carbon-nitrogen hydrolase family protein [unclassified Microbacterium]MCR2811138.1 carbon-nitrogen hydrolase family protein [Microbacterium sp. zg.B185]WIM20748.1 carbon-nitrogen hydrolase family protein [Microbacterium sp. zg-B185]
MSTRVAAVQAEPEWMDLTATTDKTIALMAEAESQGARLVAFPELWLPGYPVFLLSTNAFEELPYVARYRAEALAVDGPEMLRIRAAARDLGIIVGFGFAERGASTLYMSQCVVDEHGAIVLHRRKLKPTHVERILFGQGDGSDLQVVQTSVGRIGALNCAENMQPLSKFALIAQDEQIRIASWPPLNYFGGAMLSAEGTIALNQSNAMEASEFVLMSSQIVTEKGVAVFSSEAGGEAPPFRGGGYARIFGPDTTLLSDTLPPDQEGIVYADIDLGFIDIANHFFDPVGHYSRPDIFQVTIDRRRKAAFEELVTADTRSYPPLDADD